MKRSPLCLTITKKRIDRDMIDKKELRKEIKLRKASLTSEQKAVECQQVWQQIESMPCFIESQHILLYHSLPDELNTHSIIDEWVSKGKDIYLPVVVGDDLILRHYSHDAMQQGEFNIMEPTGNEINPSTIELIVVPGVAFDNNCNRLGRGKGYYDRLLSRTTATCIGVCYNCQLVDEIPTEPHDHSMHYIVTPQSIVEKP